MTIGERYTIDGQHFNRQELIDYASGIVQSADAPDWKKDIYQFIIDFLEGTHELVQKTSGTTGDPKQIILRRDAMIRSAEMTIQHFGLKQHDKALLCLPVQYIAGKMMVVRALVGGLNLILAAPGSNPVETLSTDIQFAAMVPLQVYESLETPQKLNLIEKLLIGGGEIHPQLLKKIRKLTKGEVYESFAMSETYSHFATRRLSGCEDDPWFACLPGVSTALDNRGCLVVDFPGVTSGPVVTNDLAELKGPGTFKWKGRYDNIIKSGGIKIIPEILEEKIRTVIDRELVLIDVPDDKLGQKMVLVVEGNPDQSIDSWKKAIAVILPRHEQPKEIICIDQFPRNKSMKVDRSVLRAKLNSE